MLHESVTLFLLNLFSTSEANSVLPYVPVAFEGRDIMEYWNSNSSVLGNIPLNITSKDENEIERIYQLWFSSSDNLNTFKQNHTHYLPPYILRLRITRWSS